MNAFLDVINKKIHKHATITTNPKAKFSLADKP